MVLFLILSDRCLWLYRIPSMGTFPLIQFLGAFEFSFDLLFCMFFFSWNRFKTISHSLEETLTMWQPLVNPLVSTTPWYTLLPFFHINLMISSSSSNTRRQWPMRLMMLKTGGQMVSNLLLVQKKLFKNAILQSGFPGTIVSSQEPWLKLQHLSPPFHRTCWWIITLYLVDCPGLTGIPSRDRGWDSLQDCLWKSFNQGRYRDRTPKSPTSPVGRCAPESPPSASRASHGLCNRELTQSHLAIILGRPITQRGQVESPRQVSAARRDQGRRQSVYVTTSIFQAWRIWFHVSNDPSSSSTRQIGSTLPSRVPRRWSTESNQGSMGGRNERSAVSRAWSSLCWYSQLYTPCWIERRTGSLCLSIECNGP